MTNKINQNLKLMKPTIMTLVLLITCQTTQAQGTGTMTDPRDGQTYKTVEFKNVLQRISMTWMAENINFKVSDSKPYSKIEKYNDKLGLLYTREAAQNICPVGWHLPSNLEWVLLVNLNGGGMIAGGDLKSTIGWNSLGMGVNFSGFSGLAGGYRSSGGRLEGLGMVGGWWSSTRAEDGSAIGVSLRYDNSAVGLSSQKKDYSFSCRCVKD